MPRVRLPAMMGEMVDDLRLFDKRMRTVARDGRCGRLGGKDAHQAPTSLVTRWWCVSAIKSREETTGQRPRSEGLLW